MSYISSKLFKIVRVWNYTGKHWSWPRCRLQTLPTHGTQKSLRVAYKWSSLHVILSKGPIKTALGLPVHAKLLPNILSYPQENNPKNGYAFHLWHISPPLLLLNFPFSWQSKNNVQNCFRQKMLLWDLWFSLLVEVVAMKFTSKIAPSCWSSLHYYAMHFLGQP